MTITQKLTETTYIFFNAFLKSSGISLIAATQGTVIYLIRHLIISEMLCMNSVDTCSWLLQSLVLLKADWNKNVDLKLLFSFTYAVCSTLSTNKLLTFNYIKDSSYCGFPVFILRIALVCVGLIHRYIWNLLVNATSLWISTSISIPHYIYRYLNHIHLIYNIQCNIIIIITSNITTFCYCYDVMMTKMRFKFWLASQNWFIIIFIIIVVVVAERLASLLRQLTCSWCSPELLS